MCISGYVDPMISIHRYDPIVYIEVLYIGVWSAPPSPHKHASHVLFLVLTHTQALKDAREVMPSPSPSTNARLPPVAVSGEGKGGDATNGSPTLSTPPSGAITVAPGRDEAGIAAPMVAGGGGGTRGGGEGLSHAERLEARAGEVMGRVVGLAAFCDRAGASKDLEVYMYDAVVIFLLCMLTGTADVFFFLLLLLALEFFGGTQAFRSLFLLHTLLIFFMFVFFFVFLFLVFFFSCFFLLVCFFVSHCFVCGYCVFAMFGCCLISFLLRCCLVSFLVRCCCYCFCRC